MPAKWKRPSSCLRAVVLFISPVVQPVVPGDVMVVHKVRENYPYQSCIAMQEVRMCGQGEQRRRMTRSGRPISILTLGCHIHWTPLKLAKSHHHPRTLNCRQEEARSSKSAPPSRYYLSPSEVCVKSVSRSLEEHEATAGYVQRARWKPSGAGDVAVWLMVPLTSKIDWEE